MDCWRGNGGSRLAFDAQDEPHSEAALKPGTTQKQRHKAAATF